MIQVTSLASSSRGNAYTVTDGIVTLLLECGISWKRTQKLLNFKTSEIAACLVSHSHKDHCVAAADVMKAGIDVYASQETGNTLTQHHRLKVAKPLEKITIGSWAVLPFPTEHDCPGSMGFLLANSVGEKLLFATDTYYIRYKFSGLNVIMIECNYAADILAEKVAAGHVPVGLRNRLLKSHFSLANVKEFLRANDLSQVKEIHLLHLSEGNSDSERFRREVQEITGKPVYVADA